MKSQGAIWKTQNTWGNWNHSNTHLKALTCKTEHQSTSYKKVLILAISRTLQAWIEGEQEAEVEQEEDEDKVKVEESMHGPLFLMI